MTTTSQEKNEIKVPTAGMIFLKATLLSLVFALVLLFITAIGVGIFAYVKLQQFAHSAGTTVPELREIVSTGLNTQPDQTDNRKNILLLGLDTLEYRPGSPALTDTVMLASLDLGTGKVTTLSLPRDLWIADYQTRINALYFYGQERYPDEPERFPTEVIEQLVGIPIHHTIVLSFEEVAALIDTFGGIEIDVPTAFTDTQFPNPDVDVTQVSDPKILYQTISFETGLQTMSGEKALQYMRSRKSGDEEGTDIARGNRQQQVIEAVIQRVSQLHPTKDTQLLADLFALYRSTYDKQFPITQAIGTIKTLLPVKDSISFKSTAISIYPEDPQGVITNPPVQKYKGQWVYEIRNPELFAKEVQHKLLD